MIDPTHPDYKNTPVCPQRPCFDYKPTEYLPHPFVTIITPFYNPGPVFEETARSIVQQSFQMWEWLIINDGSTDPESISILEKYRNKDQRICIIDHKTNLGPSAARNTGYRAAQGEYIVQLDADNLLEPTAIEKWFWYLQSYPEYSFVKGYSVGFGAQEYLWDQGFHLDKAFLDENRVDATCMIRKTVHKAVGGYDEDICEGLEDWDFWLHCASLGCWGNTIPEYLDWYRRRSDHSDRWANWDNAEKQRVFRKQLRQRYAQLWDNGFPQIQPHGHMPNDSVPDHLPCKNNLLKNKRRLLMIVPWLSIGGADKFNLDLLKQLIQRGWEVTIATTLNGDRSWLPYFARYTPDIFVLQHFLCLVDYPRFLRYLISSRQVDDILISHSELGYMLLPYLRAHFPEIPFIDFCHIDEARWKNGGYPRLAVEYQELLDLNIVSSEYLKGWMIKRGAEPKKICVCYTNVDPKIWQSDSKQRSNTRQQLQLDGTISVILYAGRICSQKQPRVFAQTMLKLQQKNLNFNALVAGDGPDFKWLQSFIEKHKLNSQVHLLGAVSNEQIKRLMTASDIFFLPSQWEGIALSIYEAMACGLPIVGADVGGQRELVIPQCGVLITRSDEKTEVEHYAEVLAELLKNPQHSMQMGKAGRMLVLKNFQLDQMGEQMIVLFKQASNFHRTSPLTRSSLGVGRICATQAVEYARLYQLSEQLWNERYSSSKAKAVFIANNWRAQVYSVLQRIYHPFYQWGIKRGGVWYFRPAEKIKQALLRPPRKIGV